MNPMIAAKAATAKKLLSKAKHSKPYAKVAASWLGKAVKLGLAVAVAWMVLLVVFWVISLFNRGDDWKVTTEPTANPVLLQILQRSERCGDIYPIKETFSDSTQWNFMGFGIPGTGSTTTATIVLNARSCIDMSKAAVTHTGTTEHPAFTDKITLYLPPAGLATPWIDEANSGITSQHVGILQRGINLVTGSDGGMARAGDRIRGSAIIWSVIKSLWPDEKMNSDLEADVRTEYENLLKWAGFENVEVIFTKDIPEDSYRPSPPLVDEATAKG